MGKLLDLDDKECVAKVIELIYIIWKARNLFIFEGNNIPLLQLLA